MRRVLMIALAIALVSCFPLFSLSRTKSFNIQGAYEAETELIVEPIPSQTQSYLIGMPFNIEDRQVQYGQTESGRMIARWSLLTNDPNVVLKVKAEQLKHTQRDSTPLDYELRLFYRLGYYDESGLLIDGGNSDALVYTATAANEEKSYDIFASAIKEGTYIGSIDGSIYFMFTEGSSAMLNPADGSDPAYEKEKNPDAYFPGGEYAAQVTLTLEARE